MKLSNTKIILLSIIVLNLVFILSQVLLSKKTAEATTHDAPHFFPEEILLSDDILELELRLASHEEKMDRLQKTIEEKNYTISNISNCIVEKTHGKSCISESELMKIFQDCIK